MARPRRNATGLSAIEERQGNSSNRRPTRQQQQHNNAAWPFSVATLLSLPGYTLLAIIILLIAVGIALYPRWESSAKPVGTLHRRSYFYVGQSYIERGNTKVPSGMMYVEHLTPAKITQPYPLLFLAGNGMSGANFLNTPDGRLGWADYFLSEGYEVFLVDQPSRGRSAWKMEADEYSVHNTRIIEARFTATQRYKLWPQASLLKQWPGNGSVGDDVFDNFMAATLPRMASWLNASVAMKAAGTQLLDKIGPVILVTHSMAGQYGWILADARPSHVKAIVAVEPIGPPFTEGVFPPKPPARPYGLTEIPLTFDPPIKSAAELNPIAIWSTPFVTCFQQKEPPRRLINLANIPVLVVTSQSGYHAVYDNCSVEFLRQAGISVNHVKLEDEGMFGNGHMLFMELNNLVIAEKVVASWILKLRRELHWYKSV